MVAAGCPKRRENSSNLMRGIAFVLGANQLDRSIGARVGDEDDLVVLGDGGEDRRIVARNRGSVCSSL